MDQCVSMAGASEQVGMPTQSWGWLVEVPVLGEGQVQLRAAESEQPTRQPEGRVRKVGGKLGCWLRLGGRLVFEVLE